MSLEEITFSVRPSAEGGFTADCRVADGLIATQGETWEDLEAMVKDAVQCHFGDVATAPLRIRLQLVEDRVLEAMA